MHTEIRKNWPRLAIALIIVCFGMFLVVQGIYGLFNPSQRLKAPRGNVTLEIVDTPDSRQLGLSGRDSIGKTNGMLFVFDEGEENTCFWMKDMRFAIDMVWMDKDKKVVTILENIGPDTYPSSFCPDSEALYGLELASGQSSKFGIEVGSALEFEYPAP